MQFFENIRRRRSRAAAARHRQWWETAAEFPVEPPADFDPDIANFPASEFDPMGSYTGNPIDGGEPIQDADDL
ncbi:MAG: hypothetical protein FWB76_01040 [Oscillospiraceae bacterium]|nr:hypothetical protein [Oscillospiraceae bacterium]